MKFPKKKYDSDTIEEAFSFALRMKENNYVISDPKDIFILLNLHEKIFRKINAYSMKDPKDIYSYVFRDIILFIKKFKKDYEFAKFFYRLLNLKRN